MAKRKTISVEWLRNKVNGRNHCSICSPAERAAWNSVLEDVLHETGNYQGFVYLVRDEVPAGETPGIERRRQQDGSIKTTFPDDTRRKYF